jgi:cytochrome c-type biogenesis protein CcmH
MRWLRVVLVIAALVPAPHALAVQPDEILSDPALEARARALSKELRCMVCQNQSIDDSDAPLARDLRVLVRERLVAGDSDRQVIDFLVARYGEFVLLKPRLSWRTALLWLGPPSVLLVGGFMLFAIARRERRRGPATAESARGAKLSASEEARLARILEQGEG